MKILKSPKPHFESWLHRTAVDLFGTWGAYFFVHCIECALDGCTPDSFSFDDTERLKLWLNTPFKRNVKHVLWYARYVDGKMSYQQVRDRHQELADEDKTRDAIIMAIKRIRRTLRVK